MASDEFYELRARVRRPHSLALRLVIALRTIDDAQRAMEFTRIHVKAVEKVDLGKSLQDDPKAAFARIISG